MTAEKYILLVEDDADINEAIQSILEAEGLSVSSTYNGKEALDFLNAAKIMPSLILLDIMMPHMNGYEFRAAQLQNAEMAHIPTIILSAAGVHEDIEKLHFTECLKKPLDLDTLIDVVKRSLNS